MFKKFIQNKLFLVIFGFLIVFGFSFLLTSNFLLAADECGDNVLAGVEWDYDSGLCGSWWGVDTGNSSSSCWGSDMCCGDDSNEYNKGRWRWEGVSDPNDRADIPEDAGDDGCCDRVGDCVVQGVCYEQDQTHYVSHPYGENGPYFCIDVWYDLDYDSSKCTIGPAPYIYDWLPTGGEYIDFGEYDRAGESECCGDDDNEEVASCSTNGSIDWSCSGVEACCDDTFNSCVSPDQGCYVFEDIINVNPGGDDDTAWCNNGNWEDCDYEEVACEGETISFFGTSVDVGCWLDWATAGESGVGEFGGMGSSGCCGDDSNEYYKSGICCSSDSDINSDGHCCPSGQVWNGSSCGAPNNPPTISNLRQYANTVNKSEGSWINDSTPYFRFDLADPDSGDPNGKVGYQVQVDNDSGFGSTVIEYTWEGSTTNPNIDEKYDVNSGILNNNTCYYWRVRAKDSPGLTSDWADDDNGFDGSGQDFCVDLVSPTVSVSGAPGDWQTSNASASVSCSDTGGSGCSSSTYRLKEYTSSGSCSTTYGDYTLTSPQTVSSHKWYCAAAQDGAGNTGFSATRIEFKVDTTNPTVSNARAHCDSYSDTCEQDDDTQIYFTWDYSDADSGIANCWAELNDNIPDEDAGTDGLDTDTGVLGTNTYYVRCRDIAGRYSSTINDTITINTDAGGPTLSASPEDSGGWKRGDTSVTLLVSDSSGVAEAKFRWDNSDAEGGGTLFNNNDVINSPCSGAHRLYLWAKDDLDNESTWASAVDAYKCDWDDPEVDELEVDNVGLEGSPVTNTDGTPSIYFEVSDSGGANLKQTPMFTIGVY